MNYVEDAGSNGGGAGKSDREGKTDNKGNISIAATTVGNNSLIPWGSSGKCRT